MLLSDNRDVLHVSAELWAQCDGLAAARCEWTTRQPRFDMSEAHVIMWEEWEQPSGEYLVGGGQGSSVGGGMKGGDRVLAVGAQFTLSQTATGELSQTATENCSSGNFTLRVTQESSLGASGGRQGVSGKYGVLFENLHPENYCLGLISFCCFTSKIKKHSRDFWARFRGRWQFWNELNFVVL